MLGNFSSFPPPKCLAMIFFFPWKLAQMFLLMYFFLQFFIALQSRHGILSYSVPRRYLLLLHSYREENWCSILQAQRNYCGWGSGYNSANVLGQSRNGFGCLKQQKKMPISIADNDCTLIILHIFMYFVFDSFCSFIVNFEAAGALLKNLLSKHI